MGSTSRWQPATRPLRALGAAALAALLLAGCIGTGIPVERVEKSQKEQYKDPYNSAKLSEGDTLANLFSSGSESDSGSGAQIGVNALLWRASLDTVSFMPLASADPFGGVIITDWYSDPATPKERFKATVYILDRRLRADAVRVSLFRQEKHGDRWVDAAASPEAQRQLEDQILTRARQMRIAQVEGG